MLNWIRSRFAAKPPAEPAPPKPPPTMMINELTLASGGRIGMCACPGRALYRKSNTNREAMLAIDLDAIAAWGSNGVVTLLDREELDRFGLGAIAQMTAERNMFWHNLPILDMRPPDEKFEALWTTVGPELRARLAAREAFVVHCLAGIGRTGTIVARLLVEMGYDADRAIYAVRDARPGAIQTPAQEAHVRSAKSPMGTQVGGGRPL